LDKRETYQLEDFISELSAFSFSDVLVHIDQESRAVFCLENMSETELKLPFSNRLNQIYKIALQYKRTSDVQSLCAANGILHWKVKDKIVQTPLFLLPTHCTWNKVKQEFTLRFDEQETIINPFIRHYLKNEFGLVFDYQLEASRAEIQTLLATFLKEQGFEFKFEDFYAVGNFHYHRYEIIKDLEEIQQSGEANHLVQHLLGESLSFQSEKLNLVPNNCFETDTDQEEIFACFDKEDCVVQGPPGTGKSQVLSNLIAKLLVKDSRQLLVSEKKTALEVLEKKLQGKNLHHFVFLAHAQSKASDFVFKLKNTWQFLEQADAKVKTNLLLSEQYLQQLQLSFDKLNSNSFWEDYSLQEIQNFVTSEEYQNMPYISALPTISEWKKLKGDVEYIFQNVSNTAILGKVKQAVVVQNKALDEFINELKSQFEKLQSIFEIKTKNELGLLNRKAIRLQVLSNEQAKKYAILLDSETALKKYTKLKKQFAVLKQEFEHQEKELKVWKIRPTLSQVESWKTLLESGSWFKKRKVKSEILNQITTKQIDLDILLDYSLKALQSEKSFQQVLVSLQDFGIEKPEIEMNVIDYVLREKSLISEEEWKELKQLKDLEKNKILQYASQIHDLLREIENSLNCEEDENLEMLLQHLASQCNEITVHKSYFEKLPNSLYKNLDKCANIQGVKEIVLKSNWVNFASNFPDLAQFTGQKLKQNLQQIETEEILEQDLFAQEIIARRKIKFDLYHTLLQTPSTKLNSEQKELKRGLKTGKAILVKEFSKSKQHKSIRELLTLDSKLWIDVLTPIHLSTPTHLSQNIPLEKDFFECVIFDEASQIPLPKAISSLQRASRLLIAGDSQQMAPSSFFSSMKSGVDLLHQATYYLTQRSLKHHYRSIHPELISFSNKHFYQNELIVYPSAKNIEKAVQWHYVKDGFFDQRQNELEAKEIAQKLEELITTNKTIGVAAFSEHQLSCIWKKMNVKLYGLLENKIKNNELFFKALEQVQGEECDILLISLGYGKNKAGEFHHRFGPLNQKNGSKRLNVLFTRAKEQIHFFSSVQASDFQISSNEAINLLRLYLAEIELEKTKNEFQLPLNIEAKIDKENLLIPQIYKQIEAVKELKTFHQVMGKRGWEMEFEV
jgi:superfamily I DNA and/or RNA helicase